MGSSLAIRRQAERFAALGDETRLGLVVRLSAGKSRSISELTAETRLTRQAVTKHLQVLEGAGLVRSERAGRENRFAFEVKPLGEMRDYLERVSAHWDGALDRLKSFVERD